jgi:NTE family protein
MMPLLLEKLRHEPFSLALSSGFFGFYAHAELLSALEDHGSHRASSPGSPRALAERLESLLPVSAIEDAHMPLAISIFDIFGRRTVVRKRGGVAAAIHASCALPGLFQPVWIERRPYSDGGILDRPGWLGAGAETFTLAHHLPSRGNRSLTPRPNTTVVTVRNLPLVTPFSLRRGNEAFATARKAAQKALATAIADVVAF